MTGGLTSAHPSPVSVSLRKCLPMSHLNHRRFLRLLFSVAVLSLSATMVRAQQPEPPPANPPPANPPPATPGSDAPAATPPPSVPSPPDSGGEDQPSPRFR